MLFVGMIPESVLLMLKNPVNAVLNLLLKFWGLNYPNYSSCRQFVLAFMRTNNPGSKQELPLE